MLLLNLLQPQTKAQHQVMQSKLITIKLLTVILMFGAFYGASLGYWRGEFQIIYSAIKFPIVLLLTFFGNALLNYIFVLLSGAQLSFKQSTSMVLYSMAVLSMLLASIAPITIFFAQSLPMHDALGGSSAHDIFLLMNVLVIAMSGLLSTIHAYSLLKHYCENSTIALKILVGWIAGNMFLGCQLAWNLRPFFGSPGLDIAFLRDEPFDGSFYESIFFALTR